MVSPALSWLLAPGVAPVVSERELAVMRREGLVVVVAGEHLPADAAACPGVRAHVLAQRLEPGDVVAGGAALWVRGLVDGVDVVDVCVGPERSGGSRRDPPWRRTRSTVIPVEDVERVGGLLVTTLERTAADVAVWLTAEDAAPLVAAAVAAGADPRLVLEALGQGSRPGQRLGRQHLREHLPRTG